jgi:hypothetical protein
MRLLEGENIYTTNYQSGLLVLGNESAGIRALPSVGIQYISIPRITGSGRFSECRRCGWYHLRGVRRRVMSSV